jgi:hypothetical protein
MGILKQNAGHGSDMDGQKGLEIWYPIVGKYLWTVSCQERPEYLEKYLEGPLDCTGNPGAIGVEKKMPMAGIPY